MRRLTRWEEQEVNAYMYLTRPETDIINKGDCWILSTREEDIVYTSTEEMLEDVRINLDVMEQLVDDGTIEHKEWSRAWNDKRNDPAGDCLKAIKQDAIYTLGIEEYSTEWYQLMSI